MSYDASTSPALTRQEGGYPTAWEGRVPSMVRMNSSIPAGTALAANGTYAVWVGSTGAIIAIIDAERRAPLRPGTFTITEWHAPAVAAMRSRIHP